jgi:hypothetical protein
MVLVHAALLGAAVLSLIPAIAFMKIEIAKYQAVSEIKWRPAVMNSRPAQGLWIDQNPMEQRQMSYRAIELQRQSGYYNPYLLVWLITTADAVFTFFLLALFIRTLQVRGKLAPHREHSLITAPATLAASAICTIPKLALVSWAVIFDAPGTRLLNQVGWNPIQNVQLWLQSVSTLTHFTLLLMLSTLVVLFLTASSLKRLAEIEAVARTWRNRMNRVSLYLLPLVAAVWAGMSILNEAPITFTMLTERLFWCH